MRKSPRRSHPKIAPATRPSLEALEDRCLPSGNTISGFVYQDANNNGIFNVGELPLANVTIQLRNAQNQLVGTTTTNAQGFYAFDHDGTISVAPMTLTKVVTFQNTATDFTLAGLLDRFDPSLGQLQSVEITHDGTITSEIKVENYSTMSGSSLTGTVGGFLTLTAPGINDKLTLSQNVGSINLPTFDGVIDFGGTSGASFGSKTAHSSNVITLTGNNMAPYIGGGQITVQETGTATSSASGGGNLIAQITSSGAATMTVVYHYIPSDALKPGAYTVIEPVQPAGLLDGLDAQAGVPMPNSIGTDVIPVTLVNSDVPNNNFGELPPPQLSGFVYHDANNNGVKEAGEEGIAGVLVTLTGNDDLGPVTKTAVTDANGLYQFLNVRPGAYNVAETQPAAYLDGKDTAGTLGGSATNDLISGINLPAGAASVSNNFGELKAAAISGFVWIDANNNGVKDPSEVGIQGAVVNLSGFTADGPVSKQAATDASGFYSFTNLVPGTYGIQETQPANMLDGKDAVGSQGGTLANDQISSIAVTSGMNGQNNNFGELNPAVVSGFVFSDANNNGIKDPGETGISGVTVTLTGADDMGAVSKTAVTDASGFYQFTNLRPGTYALGEGQPSGWLDGKDAIGTQGGVAGNDIMTGMPVPQAMNGQNNNFGELAPAGLSGFVYVDTNDNGVKDAGETGIGGVTVTLTGSDDVGAVSTTALTDATGFYRFQNLRPGTYTITESQPDNYKDGKDALGSLGGNAANDVFSTIAVAAGNLGANYNFGETIPENADLKIVKTAGAPVVKVGANLTYTLTVTNLGTFTAKEVVVTDDLPTDAGFVSASGLGWTFTQSGGIVTATRATLAVNQPSVITVTIKAPVVSNSLFNHTHVSSSTPDSNPLNNDSSVTTPVTVDPPPIAPLAVQLGQIPLTSKKQLVSGAGSSFVSPADKANMAFLDALYQTLQGRHPTKTELGTQFNRLKKGTARVTIVRELWNSDAHRALEAKQLYNSYLHRLPTPLEQATVVQQLKAGAQETTIVAQLLSSSEYLAAHPTANTLAGGLYLDLLGALPDTGTHQALVQSMANETVDQAVLDLLASQQGLQFTVDGLYRAILHRRASAGEMQFGALKLQTGTPQSELAIQLLASNEFVQVARASVH